MPTTLFTSSQPSKLSDTERKILKAARQEFIARGRAGGRLQSIADRAGVNKALLHYYFRSKQRLYEAVLANIIGSFLSNLADNMRFDEKETDIRHLITTMATVYIDTLRANSDFSGMFLRELAEGGRHLSAIVDAIIESSGNLPLKIVQALKAGMRAGRIRTVNPPQIFMNIMGMSAGTFFLAPVIRAMHTKIMGFEPEFNDAFFKERIQAIVEMACDGLIIKESVL